jgi:hypothetical protein
MAGANRAFAAVVHEGSWRCTGTTADICLPGAALAQGQHYHTPHNTMIASFINILITISMRGVHYDLDRI